MTRDPRNDRASKAPSWPLAPGRPTLQGTTASADFISTKLEQERPTCTATFACKLGHRFIGVHLPPRAGELKTKFAYPFT